MTRLAYLVAVLVPLGCMIYSDRRWRLFLWAAPRRGAVVLAFGTAFFVAWDWIALRRGYYAPTGSRWMLGVEAAPALPLEEIAFCVFLPYLTMVLCTALARRRS